MKRILFISSYTPSTLGAGVGYSNQLLMTLSKSCKIDLVYFDYKGEPEYIKPNRNVNVLKRVEINIWTKIKGLILLPWIFPLFTCRFNWKTCMFLKKQVKLVHYDYVYFDFSQTFAYSLFIDHPNKILMSHDVIYQKYSRMKPYLKPWVHISENSLLKTGRVIFTFSEKDCTIIKEQYGLESLATTFFLIPDVVEAKPHKNGNYFVMFGGWSREENYEAFKWFIDNIYREVAGKFTFKVIGGGMPQHILSQIKDYKDIEYLGFLSNPYPIIANAIAEIAPLHKGAGVKVKCIEALACGCPIIGTSIAFEGISLQFSSFMQCVDDPKEYVNLIKNWRFTLEERQKFKEYFIDQYNNKTILNYILGNK